MNNNTEYNNKAIALAGMFQACALVKQLAWTGKCNNESLETSIYSLLQINSPSVIDVYQNIAKLSLGLRTLINFLDANNNNSNGKKDMEDQQYVVWPLIGLMMHLQIFAG